MNRTLMFLIVIFVSRNLVFSAGETKFLKVGSWALYKMSTKTGGAAGKMMDSMATSADSDLPPGMTPEMWKMVPPDQQAKIKEQMKKNAPQMQMQQKSMQSAKDPMKSMDASLKIQVVGEEMRGGKPYVWAEMVFKMDVGKMLENIPADMKDKEGKNIKQSAMKKIADAGFPGGKVYVVVKMLLAKQTDFAKLSMDSFKPVEMIMKMGNKPVQKKTQEELGYMSGEAGKSYVVKQGYSEKESSTMQSVQEKNIDIGAKATALRAGLDPVKQLADVVKGIPGVGDMPQTQLAMAGLRGLDSMLAAFEDVNIKVKKVSETKSESNIQSETETDTVVKSQKTEILGVEKVQTKPAGTIAALHARMIRETEQVNKTDTDVDMKSETTVTKTRKVEGEGGGAKLLRAAGVEKTKKKKTGSVEMKIEDIKTESKMAMTHITEYFMSPSIPGLGLVKMVQKQETQMGDMNVSVGKSEVGMDVGGQKVKGSSDGSDPRSQMIMQGTLQQQKSAMKLSPYGDLSKTEQSTEYYLDSMGDTGAKSEL